MPEAIELLVGLTFRFGFDLFSESLRQKCPPKITTTCHVHPYRRVCQIPRECSVG